MDQVDTLGNVPGSPTTAVAGRTRGGPGMRKIDFERWVPKTARVFDLESIFAPVPDVDQGSFLRHKEIYQSDERKRRWAQPRGRALAHRLDEFPVGYSLASCSPAELASASPTGLIVNSGPVESKYLFRSAQAVS